MNDVDKGVVLAILKAIELNLNVATFTGDYAFDKKLYKEYNLDVVKNYLDEIRDIVCK